MSLFIIFHQLCATQVRKHANDVNLAQVWTFLPLPSSQPLKSRAVAGGRPSPPLPRSRRVGRHRPMDRAAPRVRAKALTPPRADLDRPPSRDLAPPLVGRWCRALAPLLTADLVLVPLLPSELIRVDRLCPRPVARMCCLLWTGRVSPSHRYRSGTARVCG